MIEVRLREHEFLFLVSSGTNEDAKGLFELNTSGVVGNIIKLLQGNKGIPSYNHQ